MRREFLFRFLSIFFGILMALTLGEIVCRFLPVNEGLGLQAVNAENPVRKFEPNRVSTWSEEWNFAYVNTVRVNNDGFVNDQDYDPEAKTPLLAVIGDSYIEATMVPYAQTLQGRLAALLGARGRVYSFASSGSGFGTYLVYAEYVRKKYRPDGLVFVIIRNDFKEALYSDERTPSYHYLDGGEGEKPRLVRVDYEPSFLRRFLRKSRLAMYLVTNVGWHRKISIPIFLGKNDAVGHIPVNPEEIHQDEAELLQDSYRASDWFLEMLSEKSGLPAEKITFVIDGPRGALYDAQKILPKQDPYFEGARDYFISLARKGGYGIIDMQEYFEKDFALNGKRFEFPTDSHWSGEGHRVVAEVIAKSELFQKIFGE